MKKIISDKIYHEHPAIGSSFCKEAAQRSLLHALKKEWEETPQMKLGSAFHCLCGQPEMFDSKYVVQKVFKAKGGMLRTTDDLTRALKRHKLKVSGKKAELIERLIEFDPKYKERIYDYQMEQFKKETAGREILTPEQFEALTAMKFVLNKHNLAPHMLKGGESEYAYFTEMEVETKYGMRKIPVKTKPDYKNKGSLIDIKTCTDASPDGFSKAVTRFGYHVQAAFYLDVHNLATGEDLKHFYFIAIETDSPYGIAVYSLDEFSIRTGRDLYKKVLREYAEYLEVVEKLGGKEPVKVGYAEDILELSLPQWEHSRAEKRVRA